MSMKTISMRLKPGEDLKKSIEQAVSSQDIKAGFIVTCVGGVNQVTARMAGATPERQDIRVFKDDYEIVSLVGTVSVNGVHLHISFSDKNGHVHGGHLKDGTLISPTAEIVIGLQENAEFSRVFDEETGFTELVVS